ncbi:MAG: sugar ABC transporter permease [Bacillati bacterium ANGP1]|uniref:Sugar ABC transporter permease n=1 Tax=Candidatus Segetimicrobium genomatis TaxID=2569760 RepID=A0A537JUN9_9BACT|nr:MAG: sugar ABC transporter permease [Terrabacteria group bacterium ANGP1]
MANQRIGEMPPRARGGLPPSVAAPPARKAARASGSRHRTPALVLLLPALIYLAVMTQVPFLLTLYYSFHFWNLMQPTLGMRFVGLANYAQIVLHDPIFRSVILNTVVITLSLLMLTVVLGLGLALLLHREFPGRGVVRTLLISPFLIMPTVSAVMWKNMLLNPVYGLFDYVLRGAGLPGPDWLATHPLLSVVAIVTWEWTPFMMLVLLAGLQSVSLELIDSARVDGAGPLGVFRFVTLPHLGLYVQIAMLLGTIYLVQVFGEIFVATSGGPGIATTNLPYYVYLTAFQYWTIGVASAIGVVTVILTTFAAMGFFRILNQAVATV